jgi:FKBP-type peptidyl-prolyl cis-trans isomerase FkpA
VKKQLVLIALFCAIFLLNWGCKKDTSCTPKTPSSESVQILSYASANGINATSDASGLYYEIISPGSGTTPTLNSKIFVTYTGKLLDGTVIDHQDVPNTTGYSLSGFIEGWRIGIPLIQKGGHIKLIVPSALAYGCAPYRGLPADAILYFDITLTDVQ